MVRQFANPFFQRFDFFFVDDDEQGDVPFRVIVDHGGEADRGPVTVNVRQDVVHADRVHNRAVVAFFRKGAEQKFGVAIFIENAEEKLFHRCCLFLGEIPFALFYNTQAEKSCLAFDFRRESDRFIPRVFLEFLRGFLLRGRKRGIR